MVQRYFNSGGMPRESPSYNMVFNKHFQFTVVLRMITFNATGSRLKPMVLEGKTTYSVGVSHLAGFQLLTDE